MLAASTFPAWHVHASVWVVVAALQIGYLVLVRRWAPPGTGPSRRHVTCWTVGVAVLWLGADYPLHDLAESRLYSAHMVQHLLLSIVVPPLLLAGCPDWFVRRLLARPRWLLPFVRSVSRPFVALVLFNAYIALSHWAEFVDLGVRNEPAHFLQHTALVLTAVAMWMPVLSPLPEIKRLAPPAQMGYLFLQSLVPTVPASFLTLSDGVMYDVYATFPRLWGVTAIEDQRIAGLIMKLAGGLLLWGFIAAVWFRWATREQEADRIARRRGVTRVPSDDAVLTWAEVEAEFRSVAPPPEPERPTTPT